MTDIFDPSVRLQLAVEIATGSPDPSTQNGGFLMTRRGVVLEETYAVNEFPSGVQYLDDRWERPTKYAYIEHCERNAIFAAARHGIQTQGLTLVAVWAACADCGRAIIQSGIDRLITIGQDPRLSHERWDDSIAIAMGMLDEAGVEVQFVPGPVGGPKLLRNGNLVSL